MTANVHSPSFSLFDILQPVYAGMYSGAVHPTAEGHAIVADAVGSDSGQTSDAPLSGLRRNMVQEWQNSGGSWFAWFPDGDIRVDRGDPFPAWLIGSLVIAVLAALAAVRGIRALRTPAEVER